MELIPFITSVTGRFIIGFVALLIGFDYVKLGLSAKTKGFAKIVGAGALAFALLGYSDISLVSQEDTPPATTVGTFTVTGSESHSYVTTDSEANAFTWAVSYNYTSDAIYGATQATLTFSIERGLGTIGLVQTYGDVTNVPSVTNSTTSVSYDILAKTGTDYSALWTRADATTAYDMITVTIGETANGAVVTLNLTLNPGAIDSMDLYESKPISLMVGGEVWTVYVMLSDTTI